MNPLRKKSERLAVTGRGVAALLLVAVPLFLTAAASPAVGSGPEGGEEYVAVRAGRILTLAGEEIENGTIIVRDGKIEELGPKVEIPWGAKVIDASNLVVMPGMVNPWSREGLSSYRRSGIRTNLLAADEIVPQEDVFRELLEAGFTTVALVPDGDGLPGQASAIRPLPGSAEKIVVAESAYIRIPFTRPSRDKKGVRDALNRAKAEIEKIEKARKEWEEKRKKAEEEKKKQEEKKKEEPPKEEPPKKEPPKEEPPKQVPPKEEPPKPEPPKEGDKGQEPTKEPEEFQPPPIDPTLEPLVRLLRKEEGVRALVEISQAEGFVHFQQLAKEFEIEVMYQILNPRQSYVTDFGGGNDTDAGLVAEAMGKAKSRLLLFPEINTVPYTLTRTSLPLKFHRAGCEVAFAPATDSRAAFQSYREKAAELVHWGFPREEALKALTLYPARMLGLGDRLGTLEKERDANLIFLDGDPLETATRVVKVMIEGKIVAQPESKP